MRNLVCRTILSKRDGGLPLHEDRSQHHQAFHINEEGTCWGFQSQTGTLWKRGTITDDDQDDDWTWSPDHLLEFSGDCTGILDLNDGHLLLSFSGGALVQADPRLRTLEAVGDVGSGILALSRSPDEDLFLLLTGHGSAVLMTRDFDPLTEVTVEQESFGEAAQVSVGWGKKETQFHGKIGKQAALAKDQDLGQDQGLAPGDDLRARVVWRDDGQYFAVSHVTSRKSRQIRVFTREGVLHATSERLPGLEHSLAWRPAGGVLASAVASPVKYEVAFLEKNGLRHGGFALPFKVGVFCLISWVNQTDKISFTLGRCFDFMASMLIDFGCPQIER